MSSLDDLRDHKKKQLPDSLMMRADYTRDGLAYITRTVGASPDTKARRYLGKLGGERCSLRFTYAEWDYAINDAVDIIINGLTCITWHASCFSW